MLVPASLYKEEIEKYFKQIQYSDKYLWYTGSIDNYDMEVKTEGDKFAFAIISDEGGLVVGYVSFRVDWYCSMAYNFSLIKFLDAPMVMARAIREVMQMVEGFNLRRIDFRCVSGNPAERGYWRILKRIDTQKKYTIRSLVFTDNIRDWKGEYHNTICFELLREGERNAE
jgi:RimJ/RimL family protein N-acetyltransferase